MRETMMKRVPSMVLWLLPVFFYLGTLTLRPLWWPGEYRFAALLLERHPWFGSLFPVRLPAALTALALGGLLAAAGKKLGMRHPVTACWVYLLLPWTFVFGRAASPVILLAFPFAAAALAELVLFQRKKGVGISGIVVFSAAPYFFGIRSVFPVLLIASVPLSLIAALHLEAWAERGDPKTADRAGAAVLGVLGGALLLYEICCALQKCRPSLHLPCPVDPAAAAVLLLPCLWLWVALGEKEHLFRKLLFFGCAAGTVLATLPGLIPARVSRIHAPGAEIRRLVGAWRPGPLRLYEAESCRGLLGWERKQKAMPLSELKFPLRENTVVIQKERKNAVPVPPEVIYHAGNCYLYCYPATKGEL